MKLSKLDNYCNIEFPRLTKYLVRMLILPFILYGVLIYKYKPAHPLMWIGYFLTAFMVASIIDMVAIRIKNAIQKTIYKEKQNKLLKISSGINAFEANAALHKLIEEGDQSEENLRLIEPLLPKAEYGPTLVIMRAMKHHSSTEAEGLTNTGETVSGSTEGTNREETLLPEKGKIGHYHLLGFQDWIIIRNTLDVYEPKYLGSEDEDEANRFPFVLGIRWDMNTGKILLVSPVAYDPAIEAYTYPLGMAVGRLVAVTEDGAEIRLPILFWLLRGLT